jgi:endonuclease/exonuclease/phosphatase family metal-dependent hydrolase
MPKRNISFSRRTFVKAVGVAATTPWIVQTLKAQGSANKNEKLKSKTHHVLSCNIRVALSRDESEGNGWDDRRALCIEVIRAQTPDIICLQEVIRPQMADLEKDFPDFFSFGFAGPAMDAYREGYHGIAKNPIMISKKRYEIISGGSYWLSETPLIAGSLSWGSGRPRHVNWVRLKDRSTQQEFRVLSTHLDHVSQHARKQQARIIVEESEQYPSEFPQLLAGDFNEDATNAVIDIIKEGGWIKDGGGWTDTYSAVHGPEDPGFTGHGFQGHKKKVEVGEKGKIDFIFFRGNVKAQHAEVIKYNKDGYYPSDHYFVSAEVLI